MQLDPIEELQVTTRRMLKKNHIPCGDWQEGEIYRYLSEIVKSQDIVPEETENHRVLKILYKPLQGYERLTKKIETLCDYFDSFDNLDTLESEKFTSIFKVCTKRKMLKKLIEERNQLTHTLRTLIK